MSADDPAGSEGEAPASWREMAVARSLDPARVRAEARGQRFLDAAVELMAEDPDKEFTVQEVVDRSRQSLRSFYLQFDGKHELLLALFEDALNKAAAQIRAAAESEADPVERLHVATTLLFELSRPDPTAKRPLFSDFAPQLLITHPNEVRVAHAPLITLFAELMSDAADADRIDTTIGVRRLAAMTMQTVMFIAQSSSPEALDAHPIEADEVWEFCSKGFLQH